MKRTVILESKVHMLYFERDVLSQVKIYKAF